MYLITKESFMQVRSNLTLKIQLLKKINKILAVSAILAVTMSVSVYAQPANNIEGVDVLREEITESTTVIAQNGNVQEYSPSYDEDNYAQTTPEMIENDDGRFYVLEKGRTAFESITKEYILYCGLDMVRSNYPPDIPLSNGTELYIAIPTGVTAQLYLNGEMLDEQQVYNIANPGRYVLNLTNINGKTESFDYTILGDNVNYLREFRMPEGFTINYVEHEGKRLTLQYNNYCQLLLDGSYKVGWICNATNTYYHTDFVLDTQPPVLALPQVTDGEAREAVTLADLEEGAVVKYKIDGTEYTTDDTQETFEEPGLYQLTVTDAAGNSTEYSFRVNIYLDVYGYVAAIMIIALIAGLVFYSKWLRKHMRVG